MQMTIKAALGSIQVALNNTRAGSKVKQEYVDAILKHAEATGTFAKICKYARDGEATLKAERQVIAGRSIKCLVFIRKGKPNVPLTKSALHKAIKANKPASAKKRKCKYCKQASCNRGWVGSALRGAISNQIAEFKQGIKNQIADCLRQNTVGSLAKANELSKCALSGKRLSRGKVHVDHVYPFSKLIVDWAKTENADLCQLQTSGRGVVKQLANARLQASWEAYHRQHATLQLTSARSNMQKGASVS